MPKMKLTSVGDITTPPPKGRVPMRPVPLRELLKSPWLLLIVPAALVCGYGASGIVYHLALNAGLPAGVAMWSGIVLCVAVFAVFFACAALAEMGVRANRREAKEKGLNPAYGTSTGWSCLSWLLPLAVVIFPGVFLIFGQCYSVADEYRHKDIMWAAVPCVAGNSVREELFIKDLAEGDTIAQEIWLDWGCPFRSRMVAFYFALRYQQYDTARRILAPLFERRVDDDVFRRALSVAVAMDAPMDIILRLAPYFIPSDPRNESIIFNLAYKECGSPWLMSMYYCSVEDIVTSLSDEDLRAFAAESPRFRACLRHPAESDIRLTDEAQACEFLRKVRHLDPATLQPLTPDEH